jgi:hypothetical protein
VGVVIRRVLGRIPNADGSRTFLVEAEFGATIVGGCRVTVPAKQMRPWMKSAGLDEERMPKAPSFFGGGSRAR